MFDLTEGLIRRKYTDAQIESILGSNFRHVLSDVWRVDPTTEDLSARVRSNAVTRSAGAPAEDSTGASRSRAGVRVEMMKIESDPN